MRADAERNRAKILDAAEEVFATSGAAGSTEEVARRAGVAVGTVFRHFPAKDDLLRAIMKRLLSRLVERAGELGGPDGLHTFFTELVAQAAARRSVIALSGVDVGAALGARTNAQDGGSGDARGGGPDEARGGGSDGARGGGSGDAHGGGLGGAHDGGSGGEVGGGLGGARGGGVGGGLGAAVGELLRQAQAAGTVRAEVELPEVLALLSGLTEGALKGGWDATLQERTLDVVRAGLSRTSV